MLTLQQASTPTDDHPDEEPIREIHALTPVPPPPPRRAQWETGSHRSSSLSSDGATSSENFTSISREFSALVLAGSTIESSDNNNTGGSNTENYNYPSGTNSNHNSAGMISSDVHYNNNNQLARIGEEELETNPLAIVPDSSAAVDEGQRRGRSAAARGGGEISVQTVKKEEAETKISAWENAKIAKINNRFKREEAVISGWENEQVQKATSWLNKIEVNINPVIN